ncbi:hypothetical protein HU200_048583 [Digitaria exilis]|uniref:Reverse transcriptase zinc-binding domain-containing protein n=1 Tax=Digitaria exilis TaxID=1010633 RepID=A0A835E9E2_9POAL|nr:hypothetical protein HU200_048583 [Digitaria exilis]
MFHRNIKPLGESFCEHCTRVMETDFHIFTECPRATAVWSLITITPRPVNCRFPWLIGQHLPLPQDTHLDVILLILWHVWKARNAAIFDHELIPPRLVLKKVLDDMISWTPRYKKLHQQWHAWKTFINSVT